MCIKCLCPERDDCSLLNLEVFVTLLIFFLFELKINISVGVILANSLSFKVMKSLVSASMGVISDAMKFSPLPFPIIRGLPLHAANIVFGQLVFMQAIA